jgi:hypothetical protein
MELFTSGEARWLGVAAGHLPEQPRVLLVSVPYALEAGDAATLGGKPASAYLLAQPAQGATAGIATVIATVPEAVGATPAAAQPGESESGPKPNFSETGNANYIPMYSDASLDLGNSVMYQSSGNIGVGTTNPQAPVHVYSSGSTNSTLPGFLFQRPDTSAETHFQHYYPGLSYVSQNMYRDASGSGWYLDSTGTAGMAMILSTNSTVEPPNINFLTLPTGGATSPTKVMVIQSSGNVGIGTPTPLTVFQVHPASNVNIGMDSLAGQARWTMFNDAGTANIPLRLQASTFEFFNGGGAVQALTIDPSGRVGIQQPTPGFPLDVAGNINSSGTVTAAAFSGVGASLTNLTPANISAGTAGINISGNAATATSASNALELGGFPPSYYVATGANGGNGNQSIVVPAVGATALSVQATDVTGANTGVGGLADGAGGTGVVGEADNGATATGVWGISANGLAGLFSGNLDVTGAITAGVKDFKIDDPVDPANKFLYHASVESSEMKTIYDGSVTLDAKGEALVQLPGWFEAVNGEFRYQLTCVGGYAPVYIAQKIANHTFKIAGGTPGLEVDWLVTGVRHDAYARSHPLQVEVEKPAHERGYYLHPELFGQPPQRSLEWADHPAQMQRLKRVAAKADDLPKP